jgi:chromosome segregation ATPase
MLESLLVEHFQIHEKKIIDLSPEVTTIVGPNDVGKSALLRALGWVTLNVPSGADFIGEFGAAPFARATLKFDGHKVIRKRSTTTNLYKLDDAVYRSFGIGSVPEDIAKALNVSEANFQWQLEPHFWFSDTAGQVSKKLNQIINLTSIDTSLANVASELRKAKATVEVTQDRLKESKEELQSLKWVQEFNEDLHELESIQDQIDELDDSILPLEILLDQTLDARDRVKTTNLAAEDGKKLIEELARVRELTDDINSLGKTLREFDKYRKASSRSVPDLSDIIIERKKADEHEERLLGLEALLNQMDQTRKLLWQLEDSQTAAETRLKSLQPRRCKECGQVLPQSSSSSPTSTSRTNHRSHGR